MKEYSNCPICNGQSFSDYLSCSDYTVSNKVFSITKCNNCEFKITNPIPLEKEIGKFYESEDYISHSNSSKSLIDKVYQAVRKYTIKKKYDLVKRGNKTKSILDVGSGTGEFLNYCKRNNLITKGIEPSESARRYSIENYNLDISEEIELDSLKDGSFDVITMWHVLEHVYHLNERVEQLKRILNDAGTLFIAVPNCSSYDAKKYGKYWAAYDLPRHLYHFTPKDIMSLMNKHGLKVTSILPMRFDSYYVSMLSEKYKNGKGSALKGLWNGLLSNIKAAGKNKYSSQIYVIEKQ
jgi:2-polyprenyl-3-methyl-5-hydroxy-6-metoxy-1,4-benzoquinol methylase